MAGHQQQKSRHCGTRMPSTKWLVIIVGLQQLEQQQRKRHILELFRGGTCTKLSMQFFSALPLKLPLKRFSVYHEKMYFHYSNSVCAPGGRNGASAARKRHTFTSHYCASASWLRSECECVCAFKLILITCWQAQARALSALLFGGELLYTSHTSNIGRLHL